MNPPVIYSLIIILCFVKKGDPKKLTRNWILFHLFGIIIALKGLMKINGIVYGMVVHFRELMLPSLWFMCW